MALKALKVHSPPFINKVLHRRIRPSPACLQMRRRMDHSSFPLRIRVPTACASSSTQAVKMETAATCLPKRAPRQWTPIAHVADELALHEFLEEHVSQLTRHFRITAVRAWNGIEHHGPAHKSEPTSQVTTTVRTQVHRPNPLAANSLRSATSTQSTSQADKRPRHPHQPQQRSATHRRNRAPNPCAMPMVC